MIVVQLMMKRLDGSQPCLVTLAHSGFKGSIFRIPINSLGFILDCGIARGGQEEEEDAGQKGGEPSGGPPEGHPGRPSATLL
jgi:hypothetical protein